MIASFLQKDLCTELEEIFKYFRLKDSSGNETTLKIYEQERPMQTALALPDEVTDEELEEGTYNAIPDEDLFPYIIVRLDSGEVEEPQGDEKIDIYLIFGVVDTGYSRQGHKDILNVMNDIHLRFSKNPALSGRFVFTGKIKWALQSQEAESTWPYFFGGMALEFEVPGIRREDPYT